MGARTSVRSIREKNCRVRAEPEDEGQDCGNGEAGVAPEAANGKADVLHEVLDEGDASRVARFILPPFDAAEGPERCGSRARWRHAVGDVGGRLSLDVIEDLVVEILLHARSMEE